MDNSKEMIFFDQNLRPEVLRGSSAPPDFASIKSRNYYLKRHAPPEFASHSGKKCSFKKPCIAVNGTPRFSNTPPSINCKYF